MYGTRLAPEMAVADEAGQTRHTHRRKLKTKASSLTPGDVFSESKAVQKCW